MSPHGSRASGAARRAEQLRPVLVPVAFALFAAGLIWLDPLRFHSPVAPAQTVPGWVTDPAPIRRARLVPEVQIAGFTYRCSDCHRLFASPPQTKRQLTQHSEIALKHGINDRCLNCHHPTNRDAFTGDGGEELPYNQPYRLCARCHGPVYRDWTHGAHGRSEGYWDKSLGKQRRALCIECHDPHQPPFPPMPPAPPPNTLRMGPQFRLQVGELTRDPLRVFRQLLNSAGEPKTFAPGRTQQPDQESDQ